MFKMVVLRYLPLVVTAFLRLVIVQAAATNKQPCDKIGIINDDGISRNFKICSRDEDNELTVKEFQCGAGGYFSADEKRCVPNGADVPKAMTTSDESQCNNYSTSSNDDDLTTITGGSYSRYCPITHGKFCENCKTLAGCLDNKFIYRMSCGSNLTCNGYTNKCTNETIPYCNKSPGMEWCPAFGLFPDPYFCNRYYFCPACGSCPYRFTCPTGQIFNYTTEECEDNTKGYYKKMACPQLPECTADFQSGSLTGNERLYYVCIEDPITNVMRHQLHKCDRKEIFNGFQCVYKYNSIVNK